MAELPHSLDASTMSGKGFGLDDHDLDDMFDDDEDELRGGGSDDAVAEAPSSRGARGARDDAEVGMSARHHSISLESPRSMPQESGPDAAIDEKGHLAEQHRMLSLQSQRAFVDLIYWKDAKATGAVFGGINIFFLLTLWLKYTVLTLLGEALLIAIGAAVLYHTASWVYAKVAKARLVDKMQEYAPVDLADVESFALHKPLEVEGYARPLAGAVEGGLVMGIAFVRKALLLTNWVCTVQCAALGYALASLGRSFDAFTLTYLCLMATFTLPKIWTLLMEQPAFRDRFGVVYEHGQTAWSAIDTHVLSRLPASDALGDSTGGGVTASPLRRRTTGGGAEGV